MEWTQSDTEYLQSYIDRIDNDNIKLKQEIKQRLMNNKYIIRALNNEELWNADAEPDEYFGVNILDYYSIDPTQTNVQNFICFETSFDELNRYNNTVKLQEIIFYILCRVDNIRDNDTSLSRTDLLAALITDEFNFEPLLGGRIHLVSDKPSVVDNKYPARTLIFEQTTDANLVKTKSGITSIINHKI